MLPFNRLLAVMMKPWFIGLFVVLCVLAFVYIDKPLAEYLSVIDFRTKFALLNWFTHLGFYMLYIVGFFCGALFFRYQVVNDVWEARFWFLWLCVVFSSGVCVILKTVLGRARPSMWLEGHAYGFYGLQAKAPFWSFPSGHTTTIMAVALGLCILFPRYFYASILAGFLVALSRVLLVHHYLTDVLTAAYLVLLEIGLLLWFLQRKSWLAPAFSLPKQYEDNQEKLNEQHTIKQTLM